MDLIPCSGAPNTFFPVGTGPAAHVAPELIPLVTRLAKVRPTWKFVAGRVGWNNFVRLLTVYAGEQKLGSIAWESAYGVDSPATRFVRRGGRYLRTRKLDVAFRTVVKDFTPASDESFATDEAVVALSEYRRAHITTPMRKLTAGPVELTAAALVGFSAGKTLTEAFETFVPGWGTGPDVEAAKMEEAFDGARCALLRQRACREGRTYVRTTIAGDPRWFHLDASQQHPPVESVLSPSPDGAPEQAEERAAFLRLMFKDGEFRSGYGYRHSEHTQVVYVDA